MDKICPLCACKGTHSRNCQLGRSLDIHKKRARDNKRIAVHKKLLANSSKNRGDTLMKRLKQMKENSDADKSQSAKKQSS